MTAPAEIAARDVTFAYAGGPPVLDGFSLSVAPGERVCLLGENGCGKTTFVLHLNGILPLQSGAITVGGVPVTEDRIGEVRRLVGAVFQDPDDQLFMQTVREDVAFGPSNLGLKGQERDDRVDEALGSVGALELAGRTSHHLSVGEKRRVALATVLSMEPSVLVLDEPTAGLDPVGKREVTDLLQGLKQTQVIVTHDLGFAAGVCERAVIMADGRVVADGDIDEVLDDDGLLERFGLA